MRVQVTPIPTRNNDTKPEITANVLVLDGGAFVGPIVLGLCPRIQCITSRDTYWTQSMQVIFQTTGVCHSLYPAQTLCLFDDPRKIGWSYAIFFEKMGCLHAFAQDDFVFEQMTLFTFGKGGERG